MNHPFPDRSNLRVALKMDFRRVLHLHLVVTMVMAMATAQFSRACAEGTYSIFGGGYIPCEACPEGTYGPDTMATSLNACLPCPAGTTSKEGSWSIYFCTGDRGDKPAGSTDISDCQDACAVKTCVGNEFCTNCLTGPCDVGAPDYAICTCPCEWGGSNCDIRLCEPGTWSLTGSPNCTDCPAGQYQDECGQTDCKLCPQGHTSHPGSSFYMTVSGVVASDRKNRWLGMHVDHDQTPPLPWWMSNPNQRV
ncbi:hypothetical protein ScPMuIL_002250 [Solemya velum]